MQEHAAVKKVWQSRKRKQRNASGKWKMESGKLIYNP